MSLLKKLAQKTDDNLTWANFGLTVLGMNEGEFPRLYVTPILFFLLVAVLAFEVQS